MRILLGPENLSYISDYIYKGFAADHDVITFNDQRERGLRFAYPGSTFADVLAQLPTGWEPDLVVWWFPEFQPLLWDIEACPYPTLLCMSDWHVVSDPVREVAAAFDVVATDRTGVELLEGTPGLNVFYAPLYGYDPDLHRRLPDVPRELDISHVGDLNPALHGRRLGYLTRTLPLCDRYRVMFYTNVKGEAYSRLLNESRITLNVTLRGEMAMRCYEAPACGSLLFCEESNKEVRQFLTPGQSCVLFGEGNLESLLVHHLEDPERLQRMADAGAEAIRPYTYRYQMNRLVQGALERLPAARRRPFRELPEAERRFRIAHLAQHTINQELPLTALHQAQAALRLRPGNPVLLNLLGCACARAADAEKDPEKRFGYYRLAQESLREAVCLGVMPRLNLARVLIRLGRGREAASVLRESMAQPYREVAYYAPLLQFFKFEWERRRRDRESLVRWQVRDLLADLVPGEASTHCRAALEHRPDIGETWLRLARALEATCEERLAALQEALRLEPASAWVRYDLIRTHWARGEHQEAMALALDTSRLFAVLPFPQQATDLLHELLDELRPTDGKP